MASSSSGGGVPPGFRFHPTDEELLHFYLKKKISFQKFDMEVIREVDLNKIEPWDLQERCKIGSTPQNEWYFFSHKDRKYPTGSRTNRATSAGFWKATGRDKCIRNTFKKIGMRKTLVFYRGRAPHGQKTDWIMHEYRLEDADTDPQATHEDGWVVCRVFKKKNLFKIGGNTTTTSSDGGGGGAHHNGGLMTMANYENQFNMNSTNSFTNNQYFLQRHHDHHHGLNYVSHIPPQYPPLEAQNFISNSDPMKPLMLSTSASNYDHHTMITNPMQARQFMSTRDDCDEISASPTAAGYQAGMDEHDQSSDQGVVVGGVVRSDDQNHLNDWDRMVLNTNHQHDQAAVASKELGFQEATPNASSMNQINQLSLRSEMDFWGYGK